MELYKPFKSKAKNKKYSVYVKGGKLIHFGDKRYGQYKDKIGYLVQPYCVPHYVRNK